MKKNNTRQMVRIASLAAIAMIFYMFEFRIIPGSPLKVDLSDFPVIIAGYTMGIGPGFLVALLKNILHALFFNKDGSIVGELANFAFAVSVMIPAVYLKKNRRFFNLALYAGGVVLVAIFMHVFNYYITFPLYGIPAEGKSKMLLSIFLPFNVVKTIILYTLLAFSRPYFDRIHG